MQTKTLTLHPFLVGQGRTANLEGVRALAVFMVFNVHALASLLTEPFFLDAPSAVVLTIKTLQAGHFGVDLFFVLSGYLIFRTLPKAGSLRSFMTKRYHRLWPVVLVTTLPEVIGREPWRIFDNLSLLMIWTTRPENFVMWSLTYEIYFYFFAAIWAIYLAKSSPIKHLPEQGIFLWGILVILFLWLVPGHFIQEPYRFVGFFWGIFLAILERNQARSETHLLVRYGAPIALCFLVGLQVWWGAFALESPIKESWRQPVYFLIAQPIFALLIFSLLQPSSALSGLFSSRPLRAIGNISYSFYVIHWLWGIRLGENLFQGLTSGWAKYIAIYTSGFALSLVFAGILFLWLEKPYFTKAGYFPLNRFRRDAAARA